MAYAQTTFATLKALLKERVGGHDNFWTNFEFGLAINEALSVWQLMVGEFSTQSQLSTSSLGGEVEDLYYPATGTSDMVVVSSTATAPLPLSVWRVGTDVQTHTTGQLYAFPKLVQGTLPEFDHGYPGWRTGTATTAEYWAPCGLNKIIFYPRPNTWVRLDYYRGDQLLVDEADYIQLGNEEINRLLDYAVWQLNIKCGTAEAFTNTEPLKQLMDLAATLRNQKLRGSLLYKDFMGADRGEGQPNRDAPNQAGGR